jgi:hypothetical protein
MTSPSSGWCRELNKIVTIAALPFAAWLAASQPLFGWSL